MRGHKLVKVGFWKDIRSLLSILDFRPDPRRLVGDVFSDETLETIARYLDHGRKIESCLGFSYCRFGCGVPDTEMGAADLSDGAFVWPEGLSHYVRVHHVALPNEFLKHILLMIQRESR